MKRIGPLIHTLSWFGRQIDENPHWQLRIHTVGFWYWTINFPIVAYMFFFQPAIWLQWGLFVTLIYLIYANWSTDLGGISSALAVINQLKKTN